MHNIWLQIKKIKFSPLDKVILFFMHTRNTYNESIKIIEIINNYLASINIEMIVIIYPRIKEILNPSLREQILYYNNYYDLLNGVEKTSGNTNKKYRNPLQQKDLIKIGIKVVDTQPYFDRPNTIGEFFLDAEHLGFKGNKVISDILYEYLFVKPYDNTTEKLTATDIERKYIEEIISGYYSKNIEINTYIEDITKKIKSRQTELGCIVANCNPFTLGHRYLIEKALEKSEKIILFVLEEDKSFFSFKDRFEMVLRGVSDLKDKVFVVPSGKFIISSFLASTVSTLFI